MTLISPSGPRSTKRSSAGKAELEGLDTERVGLVSDEAIARLCRAVSADGDDAEVTAAATRVMSAFAACLDQGPRLVLERVILSMAQAAESLPASAEPEEIRDRSRLIRRRRL